MLFTWLSKKCIDFSSYSTLIKTRGRKYRGKELRRKLDFVCLFLGSPTGYPFLLEAMRSGKNRGSARLWPGGTATTRKQN